MAKNKNKGRENQEKEKENEEIKETSQPTFDQITQENTRLKEEIKKLNPIIEGNMKKTESIPNVPIANRFDILKETTPDQLIEDESMVFQEDPLARNFLQQLKRKNNQQTRRQR